MKQLLKRITAFYSWDETASYNSCYLGYGVVDGQYACVYTLDDVTLLLQYLAKKIS